MGSIEPARSSIALSSNLNQSLETAKQNYTERHARSRKSHEEACLYMPGGNTRTVLHTQPFPLTIDRAESCNIYTVDGAQYVDFLGEYTAGIYGHNHPVIRKAVEQALDGGWNYGGHSKVEKELAKNVCERFPSIELVRFVNSGTVCQLTNMSAFILLTSSRKLT